MPVENVISDGAVPRVFEALAGAAPRLGQVRPQLLWEYRTEDIDYDSMKEIIVQRVLERGYPSDWLSVFDRYGVNEVVCVLKALPNMHPKNREFVHIVFGIPLQEMKCYTQPHSPPQHWIY
jgi:hypothetical protein